MTLQILVAGALGVGGVAALGVAVFHERRMHRHRQPGVSYGAATWRMDGGWRRADLFTEAGLQHQRRASWWGLRGIALLVAALVVWVSLGLS